MFGNSKGDRGKRKGADLMNQLGMNSMPGLGMPGMDPAAYGPDDDDDDDLEAELAALAGEEYKPPKRKSKPQKAAPMSLAEIERMAAKGMESIDDDISDTEDPDLLAELQDLQEDEYDDTNDQPSPPANQPKVQSPNNAGPPPSVYQPTIQPSQPSPVSQKAPSPSPRSIPSPKPAPPSSISSPAASSSGRPSPAPARPSPGGMVGLLQDRITMYKQASAQAKAAGEGAKQRRMDRGVKTLTDLLRQAKAGKPVNEDEIPPQVHVAGSATTPSSSSGASSSVSTPSPVTSALPTAGPSTSDTTRPSSSNTETTKLALTTRRDQYKKAALMAKREGDIPKATGYVKTAKQFDAMMEALDEGKAVDLSHMPPVPPEFAGGASQTSQQPQPVVPVQRTVPQGAGGEKHEAEEEAPQSTLEEAKALFGAPEAPGTALEALNQRLAKYKEAEASAKAEGNSSKARRMGRIVKQFQDAIKCLKAGKPVDFDELPTPPGFGPIPVGPPPRAAPAAASAPSPSRPAPVLAAHPQPPPHPSTVASARAAPAPPSGGATPKTAAPSAPTGAAKNPPVQRQNTARKSTSRADQQLAFLRERMGEFKEAAMKAKKNHDLELAKKYMRMMKGMEPMVEASEAGLPVDLSQVPPSPSASEETEFVVVNAEDCTPTGDREEVFKSLQEDLVRQIRVSVTNAQHYQKLGDVPTTAKFQKLEQNSRKDLESLKSAYRHGDPAPRFHYEMRTFSMVQSNTDLGDADMEVTIERGIQYNLPSGYSEKDMDTCVKYEMAYPSEHPQSGGTGTVKDTVNPEYKEMFKLEISRASKSFFRFVERKALKLEVYLKRGFFKGDKLLGTVNVKLQPLENKCTLHDSYDLMDGRKTAGGKLEVKIRIRDPFKSKQVEQVKEKWLVIDQFIRTVGSKSQEDTKAQKAASGGTICMEVLRFEKQTLDKQIAQLKDSLSVTQTQNLRQRSALQHEKIELQQKKLREGGVEAWKAYLASIENESIGFSQEARQFAKLGETKKAELYLTKKKYADKEIAAIKAKMGGK